jgi:hypothetical protein
MGSPASASPSRRPQPSPSSPRPARGHTSIRPTPPGPPSGCYRPAGTVWASPTTFQPIQPRHAPSPQLARPHQPPARRRQRRTVQRPSHPLDGRRPGPATPRPVRRELRFFRETRPAGRGGADPRRRRRRLSSGPGRFLFTRRAPGRPATEALSARLNSQRQIDTERLPLSATSANDGFSASSKSVLGTRFFRGARRSSIWALLSPSRAYSCEPGYVQPIGNAHFG